MPNICSYCGSANRLFCRYAKHLRLYHERLPNFSVTCNTDKCKDTFTTVKCYVRHVNKKHKTAVIDELPISSAESDTHRIFDNAEVDSEDCDDMPTTVSVEQSVNEFGKHVACCILKLREKRILPASVVQDVIDEMNFMVLHVHETYRSVFNSILQQHNISPLGVGLSDIMLCDTSVYTSVFDGIDTDYKLKNTISNIFLLAKPRENILGRQTNGKPAGFHYISVGDVLKVMLSNCDVLQHILSMSKPNMTSCHDCITSFADGSIFSCNSVFSKYPNAICLHFYIDEFEICNPIGSKRGKHKVLGAYYLVGNMANKYCYIAHN